MSPLTRWLLAATSLISFLCGVTDFGRELHFRNLIPAGIFLAVIAAIIYHAHKKTEGF